ncbi:hypothetical protein M3Y98_00828700 [Aphelenchoides besseyi]|nr:hypothetical protein M3Y98_00828700 [Aphelenchoides besseyi]KAI6195396.1 hypothetical protein M3Y96_01226900 [Aphelenchoides besseyi]
MALSESTMIPTAAKRARTSDVEANGSIDDLISEVDQLNANQKTKLFVHLFRSLYDANTSGKENENAAHFNFLCRHDGNTHKPTSLPPFDPQRIVFVKPASWIVIEHEETNTTIPEFSVLRGSQLLMESLWTDSLKLNRNTRTEYSRGRSIDRFEGLSAPSQLLYGQPNYDEDDTRDYEDQQFTCFGSPTQKPSTSTLRSSMDNKTSTTTASQDWLKCVMCRQLNDPTDQPSSAMSDTFINVENSDDEDEELDVVNTPKHSATPNLCFQIESKIEIEKTKEMAVESDSDESNCSTTNDDEDDEVWEARLRSSSFPRLRITDPLRKRAEAEAAAAKTRLVLIRSYREDKESK